MIVVEGPDGAGKTTLIEALMERFDLPVAPRVVSKDAEAMVDLKVWVDKNLLQGFHGTIYDRHRLISETIYGPILRSTPSPGFDDVLWLEPRINEFYRLKPITIYCLPNLDTVRRNIDGDQDNKTIAPYIDQIYSAYVARAAIDLALAPGRVFIWNYKSSHTNKDHEPWFFHSIEKELKARLS